MFAIFVLSAEIKRYTFCYIFTFVWGGLSFLAEPCKNRQYMTLYVTFRSLYSYHFKVCRPIGKYYLITDLHNAPLGESFFGNHDRASSTLITIIHSTFFSSFSGLVREGRSEVIWTHQRLNKLWKKTNLNNHIPAVLLQTRLLFLTLYREAPSLIILNVIG